MKQQMTAWQWHQLDYMQIICTLLQTDNHASTSSLNSVQAGCSSWCPTNSVKALKVIKAQCCQGKKQNQTSKQCATVLLPWQFHLREWGRCGRRDHGELHYGFQDMPFHCTYRYEENNITSDAQLSSRHFKSLNLCKAWETRWPPPPQLFYGPFSRTTSVNQCQKRTSGLYGAREDSEADTLTIRLGATTLD